MIKITVELKLIRDSTSLWFSLLQISISTTFHLHYSHINQLLQLVLRPRLFCPPAVPGDGSEILLNTLSGRYKPIQNRPSLIRISWNGKCYEYQIVEHRLCSRLNYILSTLKWIFEVGRIFKYYSETFNKHSFCLRWCFKNI